MYLGRMVERERDREVDILGRRGWWRRECIISRWWRERCVIR